MELQQPLPELRADQVQLERVLDNLLDNALRHTASGGQIRLQARRHGERVIISIEDNGEGIAYSQQGRIFEPFVQVGRKRAAPALDWRCARRLCNCMAGVSGVFTPRARHAILHGLAVALARQYFCEFSTFKMAALSASGVPSNRDGLKCIWKAARTWRVATSSSPVCGSRSPVAPVAAGTR